MLHQTAQRPQQQLNRVHRQHSSSSSQWACRWQPRRAEVSSRNQVIDAPRMQLLKALELRDSSHVAPTACNRQWVTCCRIIFTWLLPAFCTSQAGSAAVASIQEAATAAPGTRDMSSSLTLDNIRSSLIRQEDSIIFNFLERAQFALNPVVYQPGGVQVPGEDAART